MADGRREPDQLNLLLNLLKPTREERIAEMDEEVLDVKGAAKALGVSNRTIYNLARNGDIPAMRVGREWRFARQNLIKWVANGSEADQLKGPSRTRK